MATEDPFRRPPGSVRLVQVRLLGPLEIEGEDGPLPISGSKLRAVLAMLALDAGRAVSTDRLAEALWQDDPPAGATNALQRLVSKLRRALGSPDLVVLGPSGYVLAVDPVDVDASRLEALAATARRSVAVGDLPLALAHFAAAEGLWRGPALADFASDDFARSHIVHLDELRLALAEERVDVELAMGRDAQLVAELDALVAEHPLRERLRAQLMVALYRAGRQADALRVYQDGRIALAEQLGLEPGPELQRLESAVLRHDPALLVDPAPPVPAPSSGRSNGNLRASLTPLIGRDREVSDVSELLQRTRLATVVGPGGAGKTRLAVEVARATHASWDGTFVVELAPVADPALVAAVVATALDIAESADAPEQRVRDWCGDRRVLLVLDNCEHLVGAAAAFVDDLLSASEHVHVLATSRESLLVPGEQVWPIPPLTPADASLLFTRRATAADPGFQPDGEAAAVIDNICTRLDGLPLAIELAAARARAFSVTQIAERLDDRFHLLTGGSRTAAARQATLEAVVRWSYDLLNDDERCLFERLSVFAGGCVLDDAEAICGTDPLQGDDIADLLAALVQKSLLTVDRSSRKPRYRMLETLRQYGRERLIEREELDEALDRLGSHYARLCTGGRAAFQGRNQRAWHHAMQSDRDNVRVAFNRAIDFGDREVALGIAADLALHRWVTGTVGEGYRWLESAFACPGATAPFTLGWALMWRGFLGYLSGNADDADAQFAEGIALLRAHAGPVFEAYAMSFRAQIATEAGQPERAAAILAAAHEVLSGAADDPWVRAFRTWLQAGLALRRDVDAASHEALLRRVIPELRLAGDEFMTAVCLDLVAEFDEATGAIDAAITQRSEALDIVTNLRMARFEAALLARLGASSVLVGADAAAEQHLRAAMSLASDLKAAPVRAMALNALGDLRRRGGRLDEAENAALAAFDLYDAAGPRFSGSFSRATAAFDVPVGLATSTSVLGFVATARGDTSLAIEWQRQSFRHAHLAGQPRALAVALVGLAAATAASGDGRWAARLLGAADQLRRKSGALAAQREQEDADAVRRRAQALLGANYAHEYERGGQLAPEDVVNQGAADPE